MLSLLVILLSVPTWGAPDHFVPRQAVYRGPDGLLVYVNEITWFGRPRLFRIDFVAGRGPRGAVVLDLPAEGQPWPDLRHRARIPHGRPSRQPHAGGRAVDLAWPGVQFADGTRGEVALTLTRGGRVLTFRYRVLEPEARRRAGVACSPELDPLGERLRERLE